MFWLRCGSMVRARNTPCRVRIALSINLSDSAAPRFEFFLLKGLAMVIRSEERIPDSAVSTGMPGRDFLGSIVTQTRVLNSYRWGSQKREVADRNST